MAPLDSPKVTERAAESYFGSFHSATVTSSETARSFVQLVMKPCEDCLPSVLHSSWCRNLVLLPDGYELVFLHFQDTSEQLLALELPALES